MDSSVGPMVLFSALLSQILRLVLWAKGQYQVTDACESSVEANQEMFLMLGKHDSMPHRQPQYLLQEAQSRAVDHVVGIGALTQKLRPSAIAPGSGGCTLRPNRPELAELCQTRKQDISLLIRSMRVEGELAAVGSMA